MILKVGHSSSKKVVGPTICFALAYFHQKVWGPALAPAGPYPYYGPGRVRLISYKWHKGEFRDEQHDTMYSSSRN